jgi:hypothetical protein
MFQASRNWIGISGLINGMKRHLAQLPHKSHHKDVKKGIQLITDDGKPIDGYDFVFRELFCVAASELSERLNEPLINVGVLWDEILPKRTASNQAYIQALEKYRNDQSISIDETSSKGSADAHHLEKGLGLESEIDGRGALMFLVRRLDSDDEAQRLVSAGYKFVESSRVGNNQQIQSTEFQSKLRDMRSFIDQQVQIKAGLHLGFFAVQDSGLTKPQVLVRKDARRLLPSVPLPIKILDTCHLRLLQKVGGLPVTEVLQRLRTPGASSRSPHEEEFATHLFNAINTLRGWVQEPLFHDAILSSSIVRLPFGVDGDQANETVMMALRLKITHPVLSSGPHCQWVPLSFFRMRQVMEQSRQDFVRVLHQDFDPLKMPASRANNELTSGPATTLRRLRGVVTSADSKGKKSSLATMRRASSKNSTRSSSTVNLCPPGDGEGNETFPAVDPRDVYPPPERHYTAHQQSFLGGGIVVFQEVTVQVEANKTETHDDLSRSWSQDTAAELPNFQDLQDLQNQLSFPTTSDIELQPFGWGKTDVSVKSHRLNELSRADHNITTIAALIDTLMTESNNSGI